MCKCVYLSTLVLIYYIQLYYFIRLKTKRFVRKFGDAKNISTFENACLKNI